MKLAELKTMLVEQFFTEASGGLNIENLPQVYQELRAVLGDSKLSESVITGTHSNEPSKAFARFTKDRDAVIVILEEDGLQKKALFAAAKRGTQISYVTLTQEGYEVKKGNMKIVKDALRQAKNLNDEVDFIITTL